MKKSTFPIVALLAFVLSFQTAFSQLDIPRPSPLGRVYQAVGLNNLTIEYSRPSVKGRVIFGDLVPYGKLWRTGANAATKITITDAAKFEGKEVPAGDYSLFTIPNKDSWTIIINKDITASVNNYDPAKDAARFDVKAQTTSEKVETFTINIADVKTDNANIEILWDNMKVKFNMSTEVDSKVMKQIDQALKGPSTNDYYRFATYYFDNGKDLKKALEWVDLALKGTEMFYMVHTKAKIQAALGDYKGAIETAKHSKELAIKANSNDYIALNDKLIAEWSKKK